MLLYHLIPSQMLPTIGYKPRIALFGKEGWLGRRGHETTRVSSTSVDTNLCYFQKCLTFSKKQNFPRRRLILWRKKQRIFDNVLGYSSLLIWNLQNKIIIGHWNIELAMVLLVICLLSFALVNPWQAPVNVMWSMAFGPPGEHSRWWHMWPSSTHHQSWKTLANSWTTTALLPGWNFGKPIL